jgi:membrane-associated phospholipid phosphatase
VPSDTRFSLARYTWMWPPLARSLAKAFAPAMLLAAIGALLQRRGAAHWDEASSIWVQGPREQALIVVGFLTDWLCSWEVLLTATVIVCLVLAAKRRWLAALSASLMFPLVLAEVALKYFVPDPPASNYLQVRLLFESPHIETLTNGFPSGHAARIGFAVGWITVFLTPARYRAPVLAGILPLILFIGWTRIYVGDHSLLEIVAGLLLSLVFLLPAWTLMSLAKRQPAR